MGGRSGRWDAGWRRQPAGILSETPGRGLRLRCYASPRKSPGDVQASGGRQRGYPFACEGCCDLRRRHAVRPVRPDNFVAVAAYGELGTGYICTDKAFAEGGYEPTQSFVGPPSETLLKASIREALE